MRQRQFALLFAVSLLVWSAGNGLFPLLPVHASTLGASRVQVGFFLSAMFFVLIVGSLLGGRIPAASRKNVLIGASLLTSGGFFAMGSAAAPRYFYAATIFTWFCLGTQACLVKIYTGLMATPADRGRTFGVMSLTLGLGSLLGGTYTGFTTDRLGFAAMLRCLAAAFLVIPLCCMFIKDTPAQALAQRVAPDTVSPPPIKALPITPRFAGFLLISLAVYIAGFGDRMGTPLLMHSLGFSAAPVSAAVAFGGAVSLPLALVFGWLSDRLGRPRLLLIAYLSLAVGLALLVVATSVAMFWLSAVLVSVFFYTGNGLSSAFVTDLVPPEHLGAGLSFFEATTWAGGVIGFTLTGYLLQSFGRGVTFSIMATGALLAVLAVRLIQIRSD